MMGGISWVGVVGGISWVRVVFNMILYHLFSFSQTERKTSAKVE